MEMMFLQNFFSALFLTLNEMYNKNCEFGASKTAIDGILDSFEEGFDVFLHRGGSSTTSSSVQTTQKWLKMCVTAHLMFECTESIIHDLCSSLNSFLCFCFLLFALTIHNGLSRKQNVF
ncbi:hypothetical protein ILYODFUR_000326 [Ilyodon furcidens]|uniref:Uncharacterized protein n=1 Tax=Ilyodon furcidens TaxID=33524 RepID=A0ABV0UG97_9TELE